MVACNLAYIKLEKYRILAEYRSCKELSLAVCNILKNIRVILIKSALIDRVHPDMLVFMGLGELFFMAYCLYFLLQEHEDMKNKEEYGFVKK